MVKHLIVPILGVVAADPGVLSASSAGSRSRSSTSRSPPLAAPYNIVPPIVGVWMLIGIVLYFVLRSRTLDARARRRRDAET